MSISLCKLRKGHLPEDRSCMHRWDKVLLWCLTFFFDLSLTLQVLVSSACIQESRFSNSLHPLIYWMCWEEVAYFGFCYEKGSLFGALQKSLHFGPYLNWWPKWTFESSTGNLQGILNVHHANALFNLLPSTGCSSHTQAEGDKVPLVSQDPAEPHLSQIPSPLTVYVMVSSVSCDLTSARVSIVRKRAFNIVNLKENTGQTDA